MAFLIKKCYLKKNRCLFESVILFGCHLKSQPSFLVCVQDLLAVLLSPVEANPRSSFQLLSDSSTVKNCVTSLTESDDPDESHLEGKTGKEGC